jgi:uncharacterized protein YkwD
MHRLFKFSIITVSLVIVSGALFSCVKVLTPENLNAAVIHTTYPAASPLVETLPATETRKVDTSILLTETVPEESPNIDSASKPPVASEKTKVQSIPTTIPASAGLVELLESLTNASRMQNSLTALAMDSRLNQLAKARSAEMIELRYFSHTSLNGCDLKCRFTDSNYTALSWGENLAESTTYDMMSREELAKMFMQKWLKSDGHRDNIMSDQFTHQGIGVAQTDNRIVVTVIFAAL